MEPLVRRRAWTMLEEKKCDACFLCAFRCRSPEKEDYSARNRFSEGRIQISIRPVAWDDIWMSEWCEVGFTEPYHANNLLINALSRLIFNSSDDR